MTPEEIGALTIAEVEAISARASDALAKFAEARALLGGGPYEIGNTIQPARPSRRPPTTKGLVLTDDEIAQREALMASRIEPDEMSPEIAAAMRNGK